MSKPLNIALIGCGTVGSGVAKMLLQQPARLAARAGRPLVLKKIVVRDPNKVRGEYIPRELISSDVQAVIHDPSIDIGVELVGGVEWARRAVLDLLAAGKDVVTANKALLALHGPEVFDAARQHDRAVAFEASVAGGIPIIAALTHGLAANQILAIQGILNGTCNFILTGMTESGRTYADCLAEAQKLGYAEADPTLDVDGTDAAHKLAILAQIAFGTTIPFDAIARRGIAHINDLDIKYAKELGYTVKLLAEAWLSEQQLAMHVSPVLLRQNAPLALVRGAYNAIQVVGDIVGDTLYYGRGAGQMPTASAVLADIIDLAVGRAQKTFHTLRLWSDNGATVRMRSPDTVKTRFYLRACVEDRPGVLSEVARVLADYQISIASVIQHEASDEAGAWVQLVIMTHAAETGALKAAFAKIDQLRFLSGPSVYYPVAD